MHANSYYVYMYLRESDQTPYYVGKGTGDRMFNKSHSINIPKNLDLIKIVKDNLDDQTARELEIELIKKYGRKNNQTGILRNLTDGGEGRPGKNSTVGARRRKIAAEERLAKAKQKEEKRLAKEHARAEKARLKEEKKVRREERARQIRERNAALAAEKAAVRKALDLERRLRNKDNERGICPACNSEPVAINCHRKGKTYYRNRCDQCIRAGRAVKAEVPGWVRSGYKKKDRCERCGYRIRYAEQAAVIHADGNAKNNDWMNLKTVCVNCQIELEHSVSHGVRTGPVPD